MTVEIRYWCHLMAATSMLFVVVTPSIMLLDRRQPLVVEAVSLLPNVAYAGDTLTMRWAAREYRNCEGFVIRRFVGGHDKVIHETIAQRTVYHGNADSQLREFEIQFVIPNNLGPGPYTYEPVTIRWCNILQQYLWPIVTHTPTVSFSIVER